MSSFVYKQSYDFTFIAKDIIFNHHDTSLPDIGIKKHVLQGILYVFQNYNSLSYNMILYRGHVLDFLGM